MTWEAERKDGEIKNKKKGSGRRSDDETLETDERGKKRGIREELKGRTEVGR